MLHSLHILLSPNKNIDIFIVNAAECEPYLTADYRIDVEYAERMVTGVKIVMKVLDVSKCFVGIEDNKPDAVKVMKEALKVHLLKL